MDIRERIAELEHEQWIAWSKNIAKTGNISIKRAERWVKLWIPYSELTEDQKDQDRIWADQILAIKVEEDIRDCPECKGWEGWVKHNCTNCNGTGKQSGRTLKQVLGEL